MDKLTDYFFTGGMPEAVSAWYQYKDSSILERVEKVTDKLAEGDVVKVKVLEVDRQGRVRLSMKEVDAA